MESFLAFTGDRQTSRLQTFPTAFFSFIYAKYRQEAPLFLSHRMRIERAIYSRCYGFSRAITRETMIRGTCTGDKYFSRLDSCAAASVPRGRVASPSTIGNTRLPDRPCESRAVERSSQRVAVAADVPTFVRHAGTQFSPRITAYMHAHNCVYVCASVCARVVVIYTLQPSTFEPPIRSVDISPGYPRTIDSRPNRKSFSLRKRVEA